MLKCLIIEDDYAYALEIKIKAEEIGLKVVEIVTRYSDIESAMSSNTVDIILSDVKLDSGNYSYEYFQGKENIPPIIFFSSYKDDEQYNKSKIANPYIYLVKPFDKLTLQSAVDGALRDKRRAISKGGDIHGDDKSIFIRSKGKLVSLKHCEIMYIESEGNYCIFITKNNSKVIIRSSISNVLNQLANNNFLQVQRSFIVNIKFIKELKVAESEIILENTVLPVGRKYKREVIERISNFS